MTLVDLKDFLDTLIESIAACLDMELTIICTSPFQRVAATGFYRDNSQQAHGSIDTDAVWKHSYTRQVIEQRRPMVVIDTTNYTRTIAFPYPEYYSLILHPISLMNRVEGVIVLASFTKKQQETLIKKKTQFLRSLEKLSELIASKLEQQILIEREAATICQLKSTMEAALMGLVLCGLPNRILQINNLARQYLHFDNEIISKQLLEEVFEIAQQAREAQESRDREIRATFGTLTSSLIVQAHPIINGDHSVLCMIDQFKNVQDKIMQNTGSGFFGGEIVTSNPIMLTMIDRVKQAAKHSSNILILGESGTGKELFARMIHTSSTRRARPFVSVNCAAIPESLLESELFGYEDGAFTGARKGGKIGKFLLANEGTLFLDEIGDMPLYLQAKILRVLSDHKIDRIGGTHPVDVDVRIVAATNRNIEDMIANKEFREDLYYRLNVISFSIPPLRDRKEDIMVLAKYFIAKYSGKVEKNIHGMTAEVQRLLMEYSWPGNVRELENCIEYMITFENQNLITKDSVPNKLLQAYSQAKEKYEAPKELTLLQPNITGSLKDILRQKEREVLLELRSSYGEKLTSEQVGEICKALKISRASYYRKIAELGLDESQK